MSLRWLGCVTLAVWVCAANTTGVQAEDRSASASYRTSIEQAVREFGLGNYAEARALFRKAHGISPNARTWRGMGMAAFELKMYVDALRELAGALDNKVRPLTDEQRVQLQSLLDQSRAFVGRYQVVLQPARAHASVDGQDALFDAGNVLLLGLGDHVVSAVAEGYQEVQVPLHVDGGEDLVLRVELAADGVAAAAMAATPSPTQPPAPVSSASTTPMPSLPSRAASAAGRHGSGLSTAAWITLGGAALLAGGSVASWIVGSNRYADLDKTCGGSCPEDRLSPVKRADLLASVFLGASLLAAGTSAVLFVLDITGSDERKPQAFRIAPHGLGLRGSF